MGFKMDIPKKRERNALVIAQAKGEMLKPQRMSDKKYKPARNRNSWKDEDWGEDDSDSGTETNETVKA